MTPAVTTAEVPDLSPLIVFDSGTELNNSTGCLMDFG